MDNAAAVCTAIDMNYTDDEMGLLFGPTLGPYVLEKLKAWRAERSENPPKNTPRHSMNQDNSRLISVISRLESVERDIMSLKDAIQDFDPSDLVEQNDFDYLDERVKRLEHYTYGS